MQKEAGKHLLAYGKKIPLVNIYRMYAINIFFHAVDPQVDEGLYHNVFNIIYKKVKEFFKDEEYIGVRKYLFLRSTMKITPEVAHNKLLKYFCCTIYLGQFACMD